MDNLLKSIIKLREEKELSWREIGKKLKISHSRAYNLYRDYINKPELKDNTIEESELEQAKSKILSSHQETLTNKLIKESAMFSIMSDMLKETLKPYDSETFPIIAKTVEYGTIDKEIVIHLTDLHLGKRAGKYSSKIAKDSLIVVYKFVVKTYQELKMLGYNVIGIKVMLGGDIVDGDLLYPGHANFIDMNIYQQIGEGMSVLRDFLINLHQTTVSNVDVYHVYGNHGRVSKFTNPKNNWDNILYMFLQENLKVEGINFHDGYDWFTLVPMLDGENALLTHGDGIKSYQNIPMYGYIQAAMKWRGSIGDFKYSFIGHFHNAYFNRHNDMQLFINGQFPNDDSWALKVVKMESPPEQWVLVFGRDGIEQRNLVPLIK